MQEQDDDQPWDEAGVDPEMLAVTRENYRQMVQTYGPRLRQRSRDQIRMAHQAMLHQVGGVFIQIIPPGETDPVEVRYYPYGTRVQVVGEVLD